MKKLQASPFITSTVGFPPKSGTWDFLQLAAQEGIAAAIIAQIGNIYSPSYVYALYGCESVLSGGSTLFGQGVVFCNGEFYIFDGQTVTNPTGGNVFISNIQVTQYTTNADPVTFTDSSSHNVHNIRKVVIATGASGSGNLNSIADGDYGNWVFLPINPYPDDIENRVTANGDTITFERNRTIIYTGTSSTDVVLTCDFTNAIIGKEVIFQTAISSVTALAFTGATAIPTAGALTVTSGETSLYVKVRYLGNLSSTQYIEVTRYAV